MKLMVIDCEFNQPSRSLIEYGAICFDQKNGNIIDTIQTYIDPKEKIHPFITELTKIDDLKTMNAPDVKDAAKKLSEWKSKWQINAIPVVWGAGESNDVKQIYSQAHQESPFSSSIIDVKGAYRMLANCSAELRQKQGLRGALKSVGMEWDQRYGMPHRALADAHNTMRMYMFLSKMIFKSFEMFTDIKNI